MSSDLDPIEEGLTQLSQWTDDDPNAAPAVRRIFFEAKCWNYVQTDKFSKRTPKRHSIAHGETKTAGEQLLLLLSKFVDGSPLFVDDDIKWIRTAIPPYVWELRTSDVRLFGVFVKPDTFVVCVAGLADHIHDEDHPATTEGFATQALKLLDKLPEGLRKPVEGSDPNAVVSNYR